MTDGSGCAPCGGGAASAGTLPAFTLTRYHSFRDLSEPSSLAPGTFTTFDYTLRISGTTTNPYLQPSSFRFYDPKRSWGGQLTPRAGQVGVFEDATHVSVRDLRLYSSYDVTTSTGTPVAAGYTLRHISYGVLTENDGTRLVFAFLDIDTRSGVNYGLDPRFDQPRATLPAGAITGLGVAMLNFGSYKMARFDTVEALNASGAVLYREIFPSDGSGSTANLQSEGWQAISHGVSTYQGIVQQTTAEALPAVNSSPQGTLPGFLSFLQPSQGHQAVFTTEITGVTVATLATVRFQTNHQMSLPNQILVQVGGQWFLAGSGPTHTASSWQQQEVALSSITTWFPVSFTTGQYDWRTRLVRWVEKTGYGLSLTYPAPQAQTVDSTYRQYQTITDSYGATASFAWLPAQVGGQWAIGSVALPNQSQVSYEYAGGFLSAVNLPDGTRTTITRSVENDFTVVAIKDPAAEGTHRNKTVWLANQLGSLLPSQGTFSGSAARVRKVKNGAGEWSYWGVVIGEEGAMPKVLAYEGGNQFKVVTYSGVKYLRQFTFTPDAQGRFSAISQLGLTYDSRNQVLTYPNDTAFQRQQPSVTVDDTGVTWQRTYTPSGQVLTDQRTGDNAQSSASFDAYDQPLLSTDAIGRITENIYTNDIRRLRLSETVAKSTPAEAIRTFIYYPAGHANQFQLWKERDALWNAATPDLHETEFTYDAQQRLVSRKDPADVAGGARPVTTFAWDGATRLTSSTDPEGRQVQYAWDSRNRPTITTYADTSTEKTTYFTTESAGLYANLVKTRIDRNGNAEAFSYDGVGRVTGITLTGAVSGVVERSESRTYLTGTSLIASQTVDGDVTSFGYDHRNRVIAQTHTPRVGAPLTETVEYTDNRPVRRTDAYGRSAYTVYQTTTGFPVRQVQELIPGGVPAASRTQAALATLARIATPNPDYVIEDATFDKEQQQLTNTDGRGIVATMAYDAQGRLTSTTEAATVPTGVPATLAATVVTSYDAHGNRTSVRDARGVVTTFTYTGRNLLKTQTEAASVTAVVTAESPAIRPRPPRSPVIPIRSPANRRP